eukprot:226814-Rhodomonas_salina.1
MELGGGVGVTRAHATPYTAHTVSACHVPVHYRDRSREQHDIKSASPNSEAARARRYQGGTQLQTLEDSNANYVRYQPTCSLRDARARLPTGTSSAVCCYAHATQSPVLTTHLLPGSVAAVLARRRAHRELCSYARATRCPVLTCRMLLPGQSTPY